MNMTAVLYAILALGGIGALFGVMLSYADKKFAVPVDPREEQVRATLPGVNCGACGYAGCDRFAMAVVSGEAKIIGCIPGGMQTATAIADIMGGDVPEMRPMVAKVVCQGESGVSRQRYIYDGYDSCQSASAMAGGPKLCSYACVGLGDCVRGCAFGALKIENGLAVVDEELCTACEVCASVCPRQTIRIMPRDAAVVVRCQNRDTGREARKVCEKSCIACGRCEKVCPVDAIAVDGCARIDPDKCTRCGACVGVCPRGCITMDVTEKKR